MVVSVTEILNMTEILKHTTHIGDSVMASGGDNFCDNNSCGDVNLGGAGRLSYHQLSQRKLATVLFNSTREHRPNTIPTPPPVNPMPPVDSIPVNPTFSVYIHVPNRSNRVHGDVRKCVHIHV